MVLFENINLNQRVEVLRDGCVYRGTVKYKGCINGVRGEWVGVELDLPEGKHDGMVNARRYFLCRPGHGMFTTAAMIRFIPLKRCLRNPYRTVSRQSEVDPDLASSDISQQIKISDVEKTESFIDDAYRTRASSAKFDHHLVDDFTWKRYPLRHAVSNSMPSAVMLRPELDKSKCFGARSSGSHDQSINYVDDAEDFVRPPAIPKTHMPHSALKRYVRHGGGLHWPREMTVNTGRDSIKLAQWNDISA